MSSQRIGLILIILTATMPLAPALAGALPGSTFLDGEDRARPDAASLAIAHDTGPAPPWWTSWSHDVDQTRIDDDLEAVPWTTDLRFDIFVRYSRDVTGDDARQVSERTGTPTRPFALGQAVYALAVAPSLFANLLALPDVVAIEAEQRVVPVMTVAHQASLTLFSLDLGNGAIGRWQVMGRGVVGAVLDTGIDQEHEAFAEEMFVGGYDATIATGAMRDQLLTLNMGLIPEGIETDTPLSEVDPDDNVPGTHGTHVAGAIFGVAPNGTHIGGAPSAKFVDVKVVGGLVESRSDLPYGLGSTVLEGLDFIQRYNAGRTYLGQPENDTVRFVTLSVAETRPDLAGDSVLAHAVNRLVDTGVVVVAAAGNCGNDSNCSPRGNNTIAAPGSARQAITVGAYSDGGTAAWTDDVLADYSSVGPNGGEPKPNLVAPGTDISAPRGNPADGGRATNEYSNATGTSMAAPIVASAVALMLEANPALEPIDIKRILMATARDVGAHGWDPVSGAGALNSYFAVGVALGFMGVADPIDETGHEQDNSVDETAKAPPAPRVNNQVPDVAFEIHPRVAYPGQIIVFIDKSTDREKDAFAAFNWDFGDGSTAKGDRAAHRYEQPGEYVVRLSVTDVRGGSGNHRETVTILAPEGTAKESPGIGGAALLLVGVGLAVGLARRSRHAGGLRSGASNCHRD